VIDVHGPARQCRAMKSQRLAVTAFLALCLALSACRQTATVAACATPSSFEVQFVTLTAGHTPEAAPEDPSAWQVAGRPFFCTQHLAAVSEEQTEFGAELVLTPTEEGRTALREGTTGHVGERIMVRIEGHPHSVAVLQTPMASKVLRVNMRAKPEAEAAGFTSRLQSELARRTTP